MADTKQVEKKSSESCDKSCDGCKSCPSDVKNEELAASTDELIDEIDKVLEDAELATTFVQRGGE